MQRVKKLIYSRKPNNGTVVFMTNHMHGFCLMSKFFAKKYVRQRHQRYTKKFKDI